jgi:hypothetical protein
MCKHFFLTICVLFYEPKKECEGVSRGKVLIGYYRNFGVTASSAKAARSMAAKAITDGKIDWSDSSVEEIDLATFKQQDIAIQCTDPFQAAIWYRSGHVLFPEN